MQKYTNLKLIKYLLFDVHNTENLLKYDYFNAFDKDAIKLLLEAVKDFSDKELFPFIKEMDEKPAYFKNGKIFIHPQFETIIKKAVEMDLVSAIFSFDKGGLQLPASVFHSLYFIMEAANNHVTGYLGLTLGAANLILSFGNENLKNTYASKMLSMEWGGTMCLTEPQAGSSLSDIKTQATKVEDTDYYLIKGQKIFISAGDHQFADNFVHLILGRTKDAPAGTKGVSLFVVPNKRVTTEGLEDNHVHVLGEFKKLGQRGYCTIHISFGDEPDCRGWLVGEENRGLSYMFLLMNEARIATGRMGAGIASAAYYASLQYAKERPQGRLLNNNGKKNNNNEQTLIINHPDIKRMLLKQRAIVEGSLSLVIQTAHYLDQLKVCDKNEHEKYNLLLELLTPIVKTFPAEQGRAAVDNGLQILGGYGFTTDFILQQYYRDIRIMSIYEGTTGIQSLDLLGRKVTIKNGKALHYLMEEMTITLTEASNYKELNPYTKQLKEQSELVKTVMAKLIPKALSGDFENYLADANIFMDLLSTLVIGWQWLKLLIDMIKKIIFKYLVILVTFILLISCQNKSLKPKVEQTKNLIQFAKGFALYKTKNYTKLVIKNPYPNAKKQFVYYLVNQNQHPKIKGTNFIKIPIKKIVVTSTTHIPMIDALGESNTLKGFPNLNYISTPSVRIFIAQHKITDIGNPQQINTEVLLNLKPDVLIGFSMQSQNKMYETIKKSGIPVILNGDWLESSPLGRAEWLKFFGALYQKNNLADSIFNNIKNDYNQTKLLVLSAKESPTVLSGNLNKNIWNLPAGDSYTAQFLKDANCQYYWQNTKGNGSLNLSFETVFTKAQNADYWIAAGPFTNFKQLKAANMHYAKFKAFKTQQIYTFDLTKGITGGSLYYEEAALKPNIVLKDLIKVLHPELLPKYKPYFLRKLK